MPRSPRVRAALVVAFAVLAAGRDTRAKAPKSEAEPYPFREFPGTNEVKPLPLPAIPDNPPPHEGAMFEVPYVIEPPDIIIVEVLEALPGRPISGERLVRHDGTVNLGFYGEVHVGGLTMRQAKVKCVEHLRKFLPDDVLGLAEYDSSDGSAFDLEKPSTGAAPPAETPAPATPGEKGKSEGAGPRPGLTAPKPVRPAAWPRGRGPSTRPNAVRVPVRRATQESSPAQPFPAAQESEAVPRPRSSSPTVEIPGGANLKITIEVQGAERKPEPQPEPDVLKQAREEADRAAKEAEMAARDRTSSTEKPKQVAPGDVNRVFVDVTAYNSKYYYIQGDVAHPGRMPVTGKETVLDAINYAGGLISTADPKNVRLVRPARGGKPAKVYRVDLAAITEKGDARANYQVFAGDRIVVGRDPLVRSTIAADRLEALSQTLSNNLHQLSSASRALAQATPELNQAQRERLVREWFDLFWKASQRPGGPAPDEKTYRELLLRTLRPPGEPGAKK
jgi:protein involved in polysaccharide export with SLBB domain